MAVVRKQKHGRNRGAAIVETAVVLLILLTLTLGAIHYGWIFLRIHQITSAARQGARVAIRPDANDFDVAAAVASAMESAGLTEADYVLVPNIHVDPGEEVSVQVKVSVSNPKIVLMNIPLLPTPNPPDGMLKAKVVMAKEGPETGS